MITDFLMVMSNNSIDIRIVLLLSKWLTYIRNKGKAKQPIGVIEKPYYGINQKVEEFISEELVKINLILTICINCDWIELLSKSYSWA